MNLTDFIEYPFLQMALVAVIFLSLTSGLLSPIIISKRYAFMGASISHAALLGVSLGLSLFGQAQSSFSSIGLFLTALTVTTLLSLFLAHSIFRQFLPGDGAIGVFLSASMGLGMIIYQTFAQGKGDLLSYLFGNILLLTIFDLILLGVLLCLVFLILYLPRRKWLLYFIDEDEAAIQGLNIRPFHYGLIVLLTVVIVSSVKLAGTVLINSFLLVPGLFALKTSRSVKEAFIHAPLFALSTGLIGLVLANAWELPVGASLATFQFIALGLGLKLFKRPEIQSQL